MNDKKRLMDIINIIDRGKKVVDVGTDHGLVPLYLAKNNISDEILATDISAPSLKKLEDRIDESLSKIIKTKLTNGFKGLESKNNQIAIIAGMGGNTIMNIIDDSLDFAKNLDYIIIASNIATEALRKYLNEANFFIERDFLSYENKKYYDILKVSYGRKQTLSLGEAYYGWENIKTKNPFLVEKLEIDKKKNLKFRDDIINHASDKIGLVKIDERLEAIDEVYNIWK